MNKKSGKIIFWVAAVVSCILAGFLAGYFLGEILPADNCIFSGSSLYRKRYPENGECNCNYNRCCCNSKKRSKPPESDIETSAVFYSAILSVENLCGADMYIFYYTKKAHLFS